MPAPSCASECGILIRHPMVGPASYRSGMGDLYFHRHRQLTHSGQTHLGHGAVVQFVMLATGSRWNGHSHGINVTLQQNKWSRL